MISMTSDNITQVIVTLLPIVLSPIIAYFLNWKREEIRISSYKRIFEALRETKHFCLELSEYFRTATKIRLKCSDIKRLVNDDNAIWIIYFLKKMPGYVQYENGVLSHSKRFKDKWYLVWMKRFTNFVSIFGQVIAFGGYVLFSFGLIYLNIKSNIHLGVNILFAIMIIFSAFGFVFASNMKAENEKIDELIDLHAKKENDNEEKNNVCN